LKGELMNDLERKRAKYDLYRALKVKLRRKLAKLYNEDVANALMNLPSASSSRTIGVLIDYARYRNLN
jgi:hypothetical protein